MLFCAAGGLGHLQPLLPLAEQAAAVGHEVMVSGAAALQDYVTGQGLRFVAAGPELVTNRTPLTLYDIEHERAAIGRHFIGRLGPPRARDLIALGQGWPADLIVRDEADYGAVVAAEVLGIPHATVVVSAAGGFIRQQDIEAPLAQLRATFALDPGEGVAALHRYLTLNRLPPSFRDPSDPLPGPVVAYRQDPPPRATAKDAKRVYVTLGTIFNTESGDLLARTVRATAAATTVGEVFVATGEHVDPAELGPLPNHVVAERFAEQREVLTRCSAVVSHAGSGTVHDALEQGLPQVCLPLGADQTLNAGRCAELGLGIVLAADTVSHDDIAHAVNDVLTTPGYRHAAERLQAEIQHLPELDTAVSALESLCPLSAV